MSDTEVMLFIGSFVIIIIASFLLMVSIFPPHTPLNQTQNHSIINQTINQIIPQDNNESIISIPPWKNNPGYCEKNSDCIVATLSCCPCNMGGMPQCINKEYYEEYKKTQNCPRNTICPAVYLCDQINSCVCINNTCQPA